MSRDAASSPPADATVTNHHTGETMTFLGVHRDERGEFLRVRTTLPPGGKGPPPHVHPHQDEEGTVLSGRVAVQLDGEVHEHAPGDEVVFPAGSAHTWWNAGDEPLTVEGRLRPPLRFEPFVREMFAAMNAGRDGSPSPFAAMEVLARYGPDQRLPGVPSWVQRRVFPLVVAGARALGLYPRGRSPDAGPPGAPKSRP